MKIAIAGSRGVPANYGGFETFAAELGTRLVARGYDVVTYCRTTSYPTGDAGGTWNGIRRVMIPAPRQKHLETPVSTLLAILHITFREQCDAVILVNGINAFTAWIPRLAKIPVYLNVDGIERQRAKWGAVAKLAYFLSEYLSCKLATQIIADADVIARYYTKRYRAQPAVISYGAPLIRRARPDILSRWRLKPGQYILYVSRLVPENNALGVISAYQHVRADLPLVIVGDAPYSKDYKQRVCHLASRDPRVILTGSAYGEDYRALQEGAYVYIQATSVGGTHPALLEAMGAGNAVLALDTPEHREVLIQAGYYFQDEETLAAGIEKLIANPLLRDDLAVQAQQEVARRYSWEAVVDAYELLLSG